MALRRFYAPPEDFSDDGALVTLSREETLHLSGVLRLARGDEAHVFDGEGREFLCLIADEGKRGAKRATLEVRGRAEPPCAESPLELTLAVALLKGEKFDAVVQKATELGVARIKPLATARSDVRPRREEWGSGGGAGEGASKRVARWRRIALEAAKQSGRARVPVIDEPQSLTELLSEEASAHAAGASSRRIIFAERGGRGLTETAGAWDAKPTQIIALVGPEGGWETSEIESAAGAGWEVVTLGGRILRAETAGIIVVALLQHLCGDLV